MGLFSGKDIPAVGVSIGIERVFSIMEERLQAQAQEINGMIRETETQVLVASIGNGLQGKRMEIAAQLWRAGFKVGGCMYVGALVCCCVAVFGCAFCMNRHAPTNACSYQPRVYWRTRRSLGTSPTPRWVTSWAMHSRRASHCCCCLGRMNWHVGRSRCVGVLVVRLW